MRLDDFLGRPISQFIAHNIQTEARRRMGNGQFDRMPTRLELSVPQWVDLFDGVGVDGSGCRVDCTFDMDTMVVVVSTCAGELCCLPDVPGWGSNGLVGVAPEAPKKRGRPAKQ